MALISILSSFSEGGLCQELSIEALSFGPIAINNRGAMLSYPEFVGDQYRISIIDHGARLDLPIAKNWREVSPVALNDHDAVLGWYSLQPMVSIDGNSGGVMVTVLFKDGSAVVIQDELQRGIENMSPPPAVTVHSSSVWVGAVGLNNAGKLFGRYGSNYSGEARSYIWDVNGAHDLGSLGGEQTLATAMNDRGDVVGYGQTSAGEVHAFLTDSSGIHDLGSFGGEDMRPVAINDRGQITGWGDLPEKDDETLTHIFLYENGSLRDLGCPKGKRCLATAMNAKGDIIGDDYLDLEDGSVETRGFLYANGRFSYLDTLVPEMKDRGSDLRPIGINDADEIIAAGSVAGIGISFVLHPKK